ncbi:MAG: DUF1003 domain-containing protein [Desulfobaccales bacterium]
MEGPSTAIECQVCHRHFKVGEVIHAHLIEKPIAQLIREKQGTWSPEGYICLGDLNLFRTGYITETLKSANQEAADLGKEMGKEIEEETKVLSMNINEAFDKSLTIGERMSDRLADFGGSWTFITLFAIVCVAWMAINTAVLMATAFDPYPYILLNLVLSCLAAIQAPVILMSQNRQEAKDRLRSEHDYEINLKAEIEIRKLHEKMDHLLMHQWQRLLDIQQLQVNQMEEISQLSSKAKDSS